MNISFNTEAIRKLLLNAFNDAELTVFCYDNYPEVHTQFSTAMGLGLKVQLLLDHCKRYGNLEKLLSQIAEKNPYQYERFKPYSKVERSQTTFSIELEGNLPELRREQLDALIAAWQSQLALLLELCSDEIETARVGGGSIILEFVIPDKARERLISLVDEDAETIRQLGLIDFSAHFRELPPGVSESLDIVDLKIQITRMGNLSIESLHSLTLAKIVDTAQLMGLVEAEQQIALTPTQVRIILFLQENESASLDSIRTNFGLGSPRHVDANLDDLVARNLLISQRKGQAVIYAIRKNE